jgi:hypothetical protein
VIKSSQLMSYNNVKEFGEMKKMIGVIASLCLVFALLGCATEKPATGVQGGMPQWVIDAMNGAPENNLVGVGTAKMATLNHSMTMAETRARGSIVRAMNSMVEGMVLDYTVGSEVDLTAALAFQENVQTSLSRAQLQGAVINVINSDTTGQWWCVVYYSLSNAGNQIRSAASSAAALAPHAAAAFDAQERMQNAFDRVSGQSWVTDN